MDVVGAVTIPIASVGNSEGNVAPLPQTMDSLEALVPASALLGNSELGDSAGNEVLRRRLYVPQLMQWTVCVRLFMMSCMPYYKIHSAW